MRDIPIEFLGEVEKKEYRQALLIKLDLIDALLYFTNFDVHILHDSQLYYPKSFQIQPVSYGDAKVVDDVTVRIDDVDRGIFASLGQRDSAVYPFTLIWSVIDKDGREVASLDIFVGEIDQWEYEPGSVTLAVSSIFHQWARETTSRYSASCRWRIFKGSECKYVDPPGSSVSTCDRTYDTCKSLVPDGGDPNKGNTDNFGGFRWLPSMVNKRIEAKQ